ncbi:helix-turn-helix transcriptional regulator [Paeniglutamicibacter psychrophenolicus]|uniref:Ribosome-binding protein aMBF1 (Putative translation factor) n=1 Tax=Paeniglutamicibacter psychrophenolicus TaxID=257454 RepID=A0ABS4W9V0_9MICC|nr:helix-turn-helix transcriptional regulator [Paeniglutamicibacter psychrophenolicus]MBP2372806.1 ribosome-binding protein aMBF1 (putative translation factor) [Paeniglutamicibacter psychrophenolicus]
MPTQPYEEFVAPFRTQWNSDVKEFSKALGAQLDSETSAQYALGQGLVAARELAGLTQPQLAQRSGVQQADISRIERGLGNPTRDTLIRLADALGMQLVLLPKDSPDLHPA